MTDNTIGKSGGPASGHGGGSGAMPGFLVDLARKAPAMMWTFTATTFLSALLLFAIQPMFAKTVLPVLGGSPSVWSVSVFFFQAALLVGYLYAHLLTTKVPPHLTGIVHLVVCLLAIFSLPIGMVTWLGEPPQGEPYLWQLGMFAASIGLPFMAVSANAPLLQAWFARSGHPDARDPYFMYAASNLGSLIALLGYPFVLEPAFGLSQLTHLWAWAYGLLVLAIGASFFLMRGAQAGGVPETAAAPDDDIAVAVPTWVNRLAWIGLAFVPAALVTAFTVHLTTDVASAPLLWVIPLALYLLTFVLVFRDPPLVSREALLFLHLVALAVALIALSQYTNDYWVVSLTGGVVFITTAMLAHRTLYEARPAPRYLTEFYLWMSFGGALGGMFTALVAPRLFIEIYEYPLLLALSMACRPGALSLPKEKTQDELLKLGAIVAVGALLIYALPGSRVPIVEQLGGATTAVVVIMALVLLGFVQYPPRQLVVAAMICAALVLLPSEVRRSYGRGDVQRSFFGVYRMNIVPRPTGFFRTLVHGTTLHGAQRLADTKGKLVDDTVPTTYYYPQSPIGQTISKRREVLGTQKGHYGIVGLGTGSSACHKQEGETWKFFEIDPVGHQDRQEPEELHLHRQVPARHRHRRRRRAAHHRQGARCQLRPVHHRCVHLRRDPGAHADQGGRRAVPQQAEAGRRGAAAYLQPPPRPGGGAGLHAEGAAGGNGRRGHAGPKGRQKGVSGADELLRGDLHQERGRAGALPEARRRERAGGSGPARLDRRLLRHPGGAPQPVARAGLRQLRHGKRRPAFLTPSARRAG